MMNEVLVKKFGTTINKCGSRSKKYAIYIDDVLCTGTTLMKDILRWCDQRHDAIRSNLQAMKDGEVELILCYIFCHLRNFHKKKSEFTYKLSAAASEKIDGFIEVPIDNHKDMSAKCEFVIPLSTNDERILSYERQINKSVDDYEREQNFKNTGNWFYRLPKIPNTESLYTSSKNRTVFENQVLLKGIEMLSKVAAPKKNIRALGYSLPSTRNFGFGALCFTWRNVPNNTPLVFWYSASSFHPFFRKKNTAKWA